MNFKALRYTGSRDNKIKLYEFIYGDKPDIFNVDFMKPVNINNNKDYIRIEKDNNILILNIISDSTYIFKEVYTTLNVGDYIIKIIYENKLKGLLLFNANEFIEETQLLENRNKIDIIHNKY